MEQTAQTIFEAIGGRMTIDALVDRFYANMDAFPEARGIRTLHAADLGRTKVTLKTYLAEWLGGPKDYSAVKGHPRMRMRHLHVRIGPAERDAWLLCMNEALDDCIADATVREQIRANMTKLADWMRNDPDNAHDQRG